MSAQEIITKAQDRMKKAIMATQNEMATLRSGRANPSILDRIVVDYYNTPTPVRQMANVSVTDGMTLVIQPYDKTVLADIERAIAKSELGLSPNNDGSVIRINLPPMSAERRKETCKTVAKMGEEGKVAIRNVRRDAMDELKKLEKTDGISEDEIHGHQDSIQKKTDAFIKEIDQLVVAKEAEIMEI
ncbi:MAG: ribosome recycling factor [Vampirovibrio sp.]|jgi:ribosome recycling factor